MSGRLLEAGSGEGGGTLNYKNTKQAEGKAFDEGIWKGQVSREMRCAGGRKEDA